jgi:hypothetical protein
MKQLLVLITTLTFAGAVYAAPILKGSPEELRQFLDPVEHTAKENFQDKVRARALNKALAQKAVFQERLGVTLVPIGFNEQMLLPYKTRDFEMEGFAANSRSRESDKSDGVLAAPPQQTFDKITYRAAIYVTFSILQE